MTTAAIITLIIIGLAIIMFATEAFSVDIIAISIMLALVIFGIITPEEGVAGFSNKATITVTFMFILSAAILKTGALQVLAHRLSKLFKFKFNFGLLMMMLMMALISAFVNNTPVVAVFIPVVIQIAHKSGQSPTKMLIPLSFASIFGGMCTLIGTSTNILVSGIAAKEGEPEIGMFEMTGIGGILLVFGILYMVLIGNRLLPNRKNTDEELKNKFNLRPYITEIELLEGSTSIQQTIMNSDLVQDLDMDIMEVRRGDQFFNLPPGDFILQKGDVLKVRCNIEKIKSLKDQAKILVSSPVKIGDDYLKGDNASVVEMVITADSEIQGKTLKELDFRRRYRAVPLAIKHRKQVKNEQLYDVKLEAGDIVLAEVKNHYIKALKKMESGQDAPFVLLSEDHITDFNKKKFITVILAVLSFIGLAAFGVLDIMIGSIAAVMFLVFAKILSMKEAYEAVNWKIIFLLAGALSLGTALQNTALDLSLAHFLIEHLGAWGPIAVISGLYFSTSILTELMSNNASAALMAPIAIATAKVLEMDSLPFLLAVMFAASATFMTPIGYQTNTMVYSAGQYKFSDFFKVGIGLNLMFWILASILIPLLYF
ncbi:MAG: SLC13 family permease [Bacteroidota bacterium]